MMAVGETRRGLDWAREQAALCRHRAATVSSREAHETLLAEARRLDAEAERLRREPPGAALATSAGR